MALTNNLKKIVDLPIFELCNQTPTATNALSATSTAHSNSRYIYYQVGTLFYRYDIQSDTWQQLASPPVGSSTLSSLKYSADEGYRGNCLGAGSSTITIPPLYTDLMIGKVINITAGAGVGQSRTVVSVSDPVILESGVGTSASSSLITDTTQRWEINQYVGYQCRIVYGQGSSQVRKILYNDANTLYFFDTYYQQLEPWNNTPFSSTSPYAAPIGTLGFQPNYFIESATLTLDTPWTTIPDATSSFLIKSGGVYMISSAAAAPWSTFQYYDVLSDTWTTKTSLGGNLTAALGTDADIEIITKETAFEASTATSGTSRTLVDTTRSMTIDRYCNFMVSIIGGTGVANGTNYFEVATPWTTIPDATSTYEIHGEANRLYMNGNGTSSMYQYSVEYDAWFTGQAYDFGICRNISLQFQGQEALSINSGNISLTGITSITAIPVNKGFGYAVGDLFTLTTAGAFGKGRVESISAGGVVETVSLYATGYSYGTGTSATTPIAPATGSTTLTVNIATIGKVARITTSTNHNLYKGDTVTIAGCSEAAWNTTYTVFAVDALTQFDLIVTAVSNSNSANANSTTRIVDASKNWIVNEHVGKIVKLDFYGTAPTSQFRSIISNTATTITVATITAGGIGTHRYAILAPEAFGSDRQYNKISQNGEGRASSGSTTTLVDSSKAWFPNQWALYRVRIIAGTGVGSEIAIVGNTATTLTAVAFGF
ncbi:MAG: hypothetical protein NTU81_00710, partial [Candidatus Nomurabacteria bacterium]|nr:hypothetical protein [Candidatus Nomurabacteria bacterium]